MNESDFNKDQRHDSISRRILSFSLDEEGHWVARLSCGHTQHLRHQPPWQNRSWVIDPQQRQAQIGQRIICGWCSQEQQSVKEN